MRAIFLGLALIQSVFRDFVWPSHRGFEGCRSVEEPTRGGRWLDCRIATLHARFERSGGAGKCQSMNRLAASNE